MLLKPHVDVKISLYYPIDKRNLYHKVKEFIVSIRIYLNLTFIIKDVVHYSWIKKMPLKVRILSHNKTATAKKGALLADIIGEAGIDLSLYCNGRGLCGKCFVAIVKGDPKNCDAQENELREQKHLGKNFRLACKYRVTQDVEIKIPATSILQKTPVLETGLRSDLEVNPSVKKYHFALEKPCLQNPYASLELLERVLRKKGLHISLEVLRKIPNTLEKESGKITVVIFKDSEIISVEKGDTSGKNYGLAADIGTTTLVLNLVNLNTGEKIDSVVANNTQMKYGADVISRISFAYMDPKNLEKLQQAIVSDLSRMIKNLLSNNKVEPNYVYEIVLAGNAPMNHFLLGVPVNSLSVAPFHTAFSSLPELAAKQLGLPIHPNGKVCIVPNIKSFVGGDITAGILAADLAGKEGNMLFIDLGTNGEIVLKKGQKIIATSTAAGPAFEGMNISSGMLALPGAIFKAEKKKSLSLHTIDGEPPRGICGTGLIDLVAIFINSGRITKNGVIKTQNRKISITKNTDLTQKDIREIQLATAAIKSGTQMMLEKFGLKKEELDGIFIAGAFGNYLNIRNAMTLGLLPPISTKKIFFIGNSSLAGAKVLLLSEAAKLKARTLAKKIQFVSLATDPKFQDTFIEALDFGWRGGD
jgi:uncharacterized 2Fe-2S/4Fe-4S cluster protein (DUF4445 family)